MEETIPVTRDKNCIHILFVSMFLVAICGIVYELIIGSISTMLQGNSVYQFSLTIGIFMFAMGIGSYLSKKMKTKMLDSFILIELLLGLIGGFSATILFTAYSYTDLYTAVMILTTLIIGILVGFEIPLLTRLVHQYHTLRIAISNILSLDCIGSLVGAVAFPILLFPLLGPIKTAFAVGFLNLLVVFIVIFTYRERILYYQKILFSSAMVTILLTAGIVNADSTSNFILQRLYQDKIIHSETSKYQHIVLTRWKNDLRLYLNGNIQFSSIDEYRYHEALVHPAMSLTHTRETVLVMGGGDGLAVREILKYKDVKAVYVVELDEAVIRLSMKNKYTAQLNGSSLDNPKVKVIIGDAYEFLEGNPQMFDVIISDLPDPNNEAVNKLYTREFFTLVKRHLSRGGIFVTQSTSCFFARKAFWCIHNSLKGAGFRVLPYHLNVPSFGDWGFNIASARPLSIDQIEIDVPTRYLTTSNVPALFSFGKDIEEVPVEINTLINPVLLNYYEEDWKRYFGI